MYQVLYRKWRSPTFSDVIGQDHVTTTLRRSLEAGRLSHAYLFTGPRGTGKTSCARILAKAVNCEQAQNGEPCNSCALCLGIDSGSILDVIEIDAASNNGVDNIRDLRDETNFTPSQGKYRVYIIDEVHMLSAGAFNALLKTLEEPPSYVIFILATTEVHKLPATVLSRCQRFDFHRLSAEDIAQRLLRVAGQEGLDLEEGAAMLLARVADGAMRDAYSLLDRCRVEGEAITAQAVAKCIGMADRRYLFELTDAFLERDIAACLELVNRLYQDACEMERLCEELLAHLRNLLILLTVRNPKEFLLCTDDDLKLYHAQAGSCSTPQLLRYMEILESTGASLRRSADRRMEMEMGLIRICTSTESTSTESAGGENATPTDAAKLERRIVELEKQVKSLQNKPSHSRPAGRQPDLPGGELAPATEPEPAGEDRLFAEWDMVLEQLRGDNPALAGILEDSSAVSRGEFVLVKSENPAFASFIRQATHANSLKETIYNITDRKVRLGIFKGHETAPSKDPLAQLAERAREFE